MVKITIAKKGTIKPIPPFKTLDEEAKFWETHSAVDEINEGTTVGFHRAAKTDTLTIRFEPDDIRKLSEKANHIGMGPTTLARMWIKEKLSSL